MEEDLRGKYLPQMDVRGNGVRDRCVYRYSKVIQENVYSYGIVFNLSLSKESDE